MATSQLGDRVHVHYVKRFQDGSVISSRSRGGAPVELTVGTDHPRLPGLGQGLVGVAEGKVVTLSLSAEQAYGLPDPGRIRRIARTRFRNDQTLTVGRLVRVESRSGPRRVRVLEVRGRGVVVDTNHPRSGQAVELEVELVAIVVPAPQVRHGKV